MAKIKKSHVKSRKTKQRSKGAKSDKTEIKRLKHEIKELKLDAKKYKTLYEESPDLYRTVDMDGIIRDCNKSYEKYFGYSKNEIIGKSVFEHTAPFGVAAHKKGFEEWKKNPIGKVVQDKEVYLKRKDGTIFPALINSTSLFNQKGKIVGIHTLIRDITEFVEARKKAEHEKILAIKLEEAESMDKLKSEFASMVTHELKTPLAPIFGHCDMLREPDLIGTLNSDQLEAVEAIRRNAKRLEKLIGNVLDAQKLELHKMKFNRENLSVEKFMQDMTQNLAPLMRDKQIKFLNTTSDNLTAYGDINKLVQVLTNIVENAVDFVPRQNGMIEMGAKNQDGHVLFYVKDNGNGIPKDKQTNLFQKFYQADTSSARKHGGNGLGLAICKGIIEELGGKIWLESEEGKGAAFYFTVPKTA